MKKWIFRDKKADNNCRINCPKHGLQNTFDLFKEEKKTQYNKSPYGYWRKGYYLGGVGCEKCFKKLPIL